MYDKLPEGRHDNEGLVAILPLEHFKPEYRKAENQLFRLGCGFGCTPTASGRACYGHYCVDGERVRQNREDFIGIANEEATKYAEELEKEWQQKKNELEM